MTAKVDGLAKLREPFPSHQINVLPKPYNRDSPKSRCQECGGYHGQPAVHLDYVGHAALTDRFLDVDPQWTWEPLALGPDGLPVFDKNGGLWIKLTLCGMTRLGYGDAQGKSGANAIKEAIGDALRNAGMRFGAALDLWHKGDLHDSRTERGNADDNQDLPVVDVQLPPVNPNAAMMRSIREAREALGWSSDDVAADFVVWNQGVGDLLTADPDTLTRYFHHLGDLDMKANQR